MRIDSSTCVATITGTPRARAPRAAISFCTRGTRSSGISRPRSPRATITRRRRPGSRRAVDRLGPLELGDDRHVGPAFSTDDRRARRVDVGGRLHEAERDQVDAERQPERQIARVLLGDAGRGSGTAAR